MKSHKLLIILIVALIIIGIVIVTNMLSFSKVQQSIVSQIKENQLIENEHASFQIESHITQVKDELITLSKFPLLESLDINKCSGSMKIVHEKIEGKLSSLLRIDKDGNVVECSSPTFSNYLGLNVKNKDYFRIPRETNEPAIISVPDGSNRQVIVAVPLFETTEYTPYPNFVGNFKGVLMSIIEVNNLYYLYIHKILESDKNYFLLVDLRTEETILKSNELLEYVELKEVLPTSEKGFNSITVISGFGQTILTSSDIFFGPEKWRFIVLTPLKNIEGEVKPLQTGHILSLIFVIAIILSIFVALISLYRSKEKVQIQLEKANVTLEKLGINVAVETGKYSQADVSLEDHKIYLIKDDQENQAHELFISTLNKGYAGLGLVREDPRTIKEKYNLKKTSFIWLSNAKVEGIPSETNLDILMELIAEFVKKSEKSVILIDRFDYLVNENPFDMIIKKIHSLKDLAHMHRCIIIVALHQDTLEPAKLKSLEAEMIDLFGKHGQGNMELTELELGMLKFINDRNILNKLVSFKDITAQYHITKPTTRVKVAKLQMLGLVIVDQRGRFKSLKITSAGRRLLE